MRSIAIAALLGSAVACASLAGQSLTEHAAAAAGGTIGTAAGKPISDALGRVFGTLDNNSAKATAKPGVKASTKASTKAAPGTHPQQEVSEKTEHTATVGVSPSTGGSGDAGDGGGGSAHRSRRETSAGRQAEEADVPVAPIVPVVTEPVVKEPTAQELGGIRAGTPANELRSVLGAPESQVTIPDDDGHLRETLQYWSHGEQIGTVRLDNGRVVSVQTNP